MRLVPGLLLAVCMAVGVSRLILAVEEDSAPKSERYVRYGERAITGDDFLAQVPDERPVEDPRAEAYSHTLVRYEYEYRQIKRGGKVRAQLTKIRFYAVFDREQSWNALPDDQRLLEHHVGHFDLAQIAALQIEMDWQKRLKREQASLVGSGKTEAEARLDLEKKIDEQLRGHEQSMQRDHQYFDEKTRYGTDADSEQRERQRQKERLEQLEDQIQAVRK